MHNLKGPWLNKERLQQTAELKTAKLKEGLQTWQHFKWSMWFWLHMCGGSHDERGRCGGAVGVMTPIPVTEEQNARQLTETQQKQEQFKTNEEQRTTRQTLIVTVTAYS